MVSVSRRAGPPHFGTGRVDELRQLAQAAIRPCWVISILFGQEAPEADRRARERCRPLVAVEHGDRRAPVALAADSPVLQAKSDRGLAEAVFLA